MSTDRDRVIGSKSEALGDLGTRCVGRYVRWHESVSSTNDIALALTEIPVPEGTVIVAERQSAGRGRLGRSWSSPQGGLWLSVILSPGLPPDRIAVVGLTAAVAAAQAIRETTGLLARLKWPNDVLVDGKKVVGILAEAAAGGEWVVVGIGINANIEQDGLHEVSGYPATSLQVLVGRPVDRLALLRALLRALDHGYALLRSAGTRATLRRWREMAGVLDRPVRVEMPTGTIHGIAHDIDETGALLVRCDDGAVRRVVAGDVRVRETGP